MYALPPVAVSGVLDRLRAPVTVTGRHGRMEACLQFEPSVFIIAVAYGLGPAMQYGRCARPLNERSPCYLVLVC